jgi:hypothetical protein
VISEAEHEQDRVAALQAAIRDLGEKVDSYKARTAAALGGGVFALLLALGGAYDLARGNAAVWGAIGLTEAQVRWLTIGLALVGGLLLVTSFIRRRNYDTTPETRLEEMEVELAEMLSNRESSSNVRETVRNT